MSTTPKTMKRIRQDSSTDAQKKGKASVELRVTLEDNVLYVNHNFTVTVLLLGADGQLHTTNSNKIRLKRPQLCYKDNLELCDASMLEVDESSWSENLENGRVSFHAKINTLSRDEAGREFCLLMDTCDPNVGPCYSAPLTVISYKLSILSSIPSKFYNQMGGGGNCIKLDLECRDFQGELVRTVVPLEIILIYSDDGEMVRTQEILTKSDDSQMSTLLGKATMKVRIEHVSRKHQNRTFSIKVRPNLLIDPLSANVASVVSSPINVLSKITPRDRRDANKINVHRQQVLSQQLGSHSNSFDGSEDGAGVGAPVSSNLPQPLMLPSSKFIATGKEVPFHNAIQNSQSGGMTAAPISDEDEVGGGGAVNRVPTNNTVPIAEALSNVLGWIDGTLKCLCDSKWQQVGYEHSGDSSLDYNRPLYAMSNPNDKIQGQLDTYRNSVMSSLQTVLEGIEPLLEAKAATDSSSSIGGGDGGDAVEDLHPEPLSHHTHEESGSHSIMQPELSRSGSNGIPGSAEFDSLVSGAVGGFESCSSDPMLPLLRGLSRGFSDFGHMGNHV